MSPPRWTNLTRAEWFTQLFPEGNLFANTGKALDHFFAYGPRAALVPPQRAAWGGFGPIDN